MNKWKIGFWVCLAFLVLVSVFSAYSLIDQAVIIDYQRDAYKNTENDLENLIDLVDKTDLTKTQIQRQLKNHALYEEMDFKKDSIYLDRVVLVFNNNKLKRVIKQW